MIRFQQPVFKKHLDALCGQSEKTASMEVKKMVFMNELYKQMTQEKQTTENVRLVTESSRETTDWMPISSEQYAGLG